MNIELKSEVMVRLPHSPHFAKIEAGTPVNYSSSKSDGDIWTHRFTVWHRPTGQILQYAETIQGKDRPIWL